MAQPSIPLNPFCDLQAGFKKLYATGVRSDMTIICGSRRFKVHTPLLIPQSSVFDMLFAGKFKESAECSSTLELDDDPEVLASLIHYFYHFTYDDSSRGEHQAIQTFTVHVYAIADKYNVPRLQQLAAQKFGKVCDPVSDIDDFITALCAVDGATNPADSTLWNITLPIIENNVSYLLQHNSFKAVVDSMPDLKWGLISLLDHKKPRELTPRAPSTPSTVSIPGFERDEDDGDEDDGDEDDGDEDDGDEEEMRPYSEWRGPGRRLG